MRKLLIILLLIIITSLPSYASVVIEDDFEYGSNAANLSACESLPGFTTIYNGDSQEHTGNISVQSTYAHSGSRALYITGLSQTNAFLEANHTYGSDVWIEMWISFSAIFIRIQIY